jgi:hypothetical protein
VGGDHNSPDGAASLGTSAFLCETGEVTERPLERAWRTALEERAWEPLEGWDAVLRRRRRGLVRDAILFAVVWPAFFVVLHGVLRDRWGWAAAWVLLGFLHAGRILRTLRRPGDRVAWEEDVRSSTRTEHALRHHASVGAEFRFVVDERAEEIRSMAGVGLVGWPLGCLIAMAVFLSAEDTGPRLVALVAALLAVIALARSQRRARWARRWLADPLPRT